MRLNVFVFSLFTYFYVGGADKILTIFPYTAKAQHNFIMPYLKALAESGHELIVISAIAPTEKIANARFIKSNEVLHIIDEIDMSAYDYPYTVWQQAIIVAKYFYKLSLSVLSNTEVLQLMNLKPHFDLIVLEVLYMDALFGFSQHFQAPIIGISVYGSAWKIDYLVGNMAPSVYEPLSYAVFTSGPNSFQRLKNWVNIIEERLVEHFIYFPYQNQLYRKYFPNSNMTLDQIKSNCSLIMINQHFSLGRPRSNVPNLVEIAGMHIPDHTEPLPDELETFISGAEHGVIYFSLGQDILFKLLPQTTIDAFFQTFRELKQRVIWKYDSDQLLNKSENIYVSSWLPQIAILAHPNVKLFITHGGRLSLIESIHYAKPVLGLPIFYDQFSNIASVESCGMAMSLEINSLTSQQLISAINEIFNNPTYTQKARKISARFQDQPMTPLQTAIWWTEYILRHQGAPHMRVNEHNFGFIDYYSIDMLIVLFFRIVLPIIIVSFLLYKSLKKFWSLSASI